MKEQRSVGWQSELARQASPGLWQRTASTRPQLSWVMAQASPPQSAAEEHSTGTHSFVGWRAALPWSRRSWRAQTHLCALSQSAAESHLGGAWHTPSMHSDSGVPQSAFDWHVRGMTPASSSGPNPSPPQLEGSSVTTRSPFAPGALHHETPVARTRDPAAFGNASSRHAGAGPSATWAAEGLDAAVRAGVGVWADLGARSPGTASVWHPPSATALHTSVAARAPARWSRDPGALLAPLVVDAVERGKAIPACFEIVRCRSMV